MEMQKSGHTEIQATDKLEFFKIAVGAKISSQDCLRVSKASQGNFSGRIQTGRSRLCKTGGALRSRTRRGSGRRPGGPPGSTGSGCYSAGVCQSRPNFLGPSFRPCTGFNLISMNLSLVP